MVAETEAAMHNRDRVRRCGVRRRILVVALTAVVLAVGLFGIPLAVAVQRAIIANEQGELERLALRAAVSVSPGYTRGDPIELPATEAGVDLAVYDTSGARVTGSGRAQLEVALETSLRGRLVDAESGNDLLVAVPVTSGERLIAVVRAASPESAVQTRIRWTRAAMAGIALVAASVAGAFAAAQSRRLSRPLTGLEKAAAELGDGNFAVRTRRSGVPEIDRAGEALDRTAERLADLVARERAFSAHASHQLRTPLTRLRLELETGLQAGDKALRDAAEEAIRSADQLSRTIDDVLQVSRGTPDQRRGFEVEDLLDDLRQRWHGVFAANDRPLRLVEGDAPASSASLPATRQVLDVLLDNAYRHGSGAVTVATRGSGGALAIDVTDEGSAPDFRLPTTPSGAASGSGSSTNLGLPLARSLAETEGGRLLLAVGERSTRLTLLLPGIE